MSPHEPLEKRRLLTAFVVDTSSDSAADAAGETDGLISLREAIIAANSNAPFGDAPAGEADGDQIVVAPELDNRLIRLGQGVLPITDDLLIDGAHPAERLVVSGSLEGGGVVAHRIFDVNTSESVTFQNLRINFGDVADQGGLIRLDSGGATLLQNLELAGGDAEEGGGAIYNVDHDLTIRESDIRANLSQGAAALGGAILSEGGRLEIFDTFFFLNRATSAGGALAITGGELHIERSDFDSNQAGAPGGEPTPNPGNGAGVFVGENLTAVIDASLFRTNLAVNEGGALWMSAGSNVTVRGDSDILANRAFGRGGGIFNDGGTLLVDFSDIFDNTAIDPEGSGGGGIFSNGGSVTVSSSQVKRNHATTNGGGLQMIGGELVLFFSDFSNNIAGSDGTSAPRTFGEGGGLHLTGVTAEIESSKLQANFASRRGDGGGLWMSADSAVAINMTFIADNSAAGSGGGIFNGGGQLTFSRSRAWDNAAAEVFTGDEVDLESDGGGIHNAAGASADVSISSIARNRSPRFGGGIYNDGDLIVNFTAINANFAASDGGGIFNDEAGELELIDAFLFDNDPNDLAGPGDS